MGFFGKSKNKSDEKATKKIQKNSRPSSRGSSNDAKAPFELPEGSGSIVHAPEASSNSNLQRELELARQKAYTRKLEEQNGRLQHAIAISAQAQLPNWSEQKARPTFLHQDSDVSAVSSQFSQAPEVVTHEMLSPSLSNVSLATVPTQDLQAKPPTQDPPASATQSSVKATAETAAHVAQSVMTTLADLPWENIGEKLAEHSQNPGLIIVLLFAVYLIYSIVMYRTMYLLIAAVVGILVVNGRKMFFVQKQAQLQGEYMRSIASNLPTVDVLPSDGSGYGNRRMIMPAPMGRVEEIVD